MVESSGYYDLNMPVTTPPRRVVSLAPALTLTLFELNLGSRVAAVSERCAALVEPARAARLPRVGDPAAPDVGRILALSPDLVMALADETPPDAVRALQAAGATVWLAAPRTVREAVNLLWDIMYAFNEAAMTPRVRLIDQTVDYVAGASASREPCRVFAPVGVDPWRAFNRDTYAHDLLRVCGGWNVFADREARDFAVTLDEVIAAQPEAALVPDDFGPDAAAALRALDIPAARTGRIYVVDDGLLTWPGTRLARALSALPPLLAPPGAGVSQT